jgi:hypothetical protein
MIMCRMTRVSGNLQGAGVTGRTRPRTVSDLLRSRRPFRNQDNYERRIMCDSAAHRAA